MIKNYECADKKLILIRIREEGCPDMEENEYLKDIHLLLPCFQLMQATQNQNASWLLGHHKVNTTILF